MIVIAHKYIAASNYVSRDSFPSTYVFSPMPRLLREIQLNQTPLDDIVFTEVCDTCRTEYIRDYEIQSIGLNYTGRDCAGGSSCPGKLKDTLLDWEDDLPELDWDRAEAECRQADLILCLGTSLRIEPAASLCTYPNSNHGNKKKSKKKMKMDEQDAKQHVQQSLGYVIVNLQPTPYDDGAALVIRAKVDDVMRGVMEKLGYGEEDWKE